MNSLQVFVPETLVIHELIPVLTKDLEQQSNPVPRRGLEVASVRWTGEKHDESRPALTNRIAAFNRDRAGRGPFDHDNRQVVDKAWEGTIVFVPSVNPEHDVKPRAEHARDYPYFAKGEPVFWATEAFKHYGYSVRVYSVETWADIATVLERYPDQSVKRMVMKGHNWGSKGCGMRGRGNVSACQPEHWINTNTLYLNRLESIPGQDYASRISPKLATGAVIDFQSCSAGGSEDDMTLLATLLNTNVRATPELTAAGPPGQVYDHVIVDEKTRHDPSIWIPVGPLKSGDWRALGLQRYPP